MAFPTPLGKYRLCGAGDIYNKLNCPALLCCVYIPLKKRLVIYHQACSQGGNLQVLTPPLILSILKSRTNQPGFPFYKKLLIGSKVRWTNYTEVLFKFGCQKYGHVKHTVTREKSEQHCGEHFAWQHQVQMYIISLNQFKWEPHNFNYGVELTFTV